MNQPGHNKDEHVEQLNAVSSQDGHHLVEKVEFLEFGPDDRSNPLNWSRRRKAMIVIGIYLTTFLVSLSSTAFTAAIPATAAQFGVSSEVMILAVSLYVLGYAAGPLLWAPLSEAYGRRYPYVISFFLFTVFQIPVAVEKNPATIILCRFISGASGSATFVIPPAMAVDFLEPVARSKAVGLYMAFVFMGTVLGPIVGAFTVANESLGWPWVAWLVLIIAAPTTLFIIISIPETYADILLQRQARIFRSRNVQVQCKRDQKEVNWRSLVYVYLSRPVQMLFLEPILLAISVYNGLFYGILYLIFFAYPYAFAKVRGWTPQDASLPFLSLAVGILLTVVGLGSVYTAWWKRRFVARSHRLLPEDRLPPLIVSGILLPTGLFWFAWTSNPDIQWAPQVISGCFIGGAIMLNVASCTSYLIDVYLVNSNSAMAANVCLRSLMGGAFPLFANAMYKKLGTEWATSLLAFLTVALAPIPILFWKYGQKLRSMSRFGFE